MSSSGFSIFDDEEGDTGPQTGSGDTTGPGIATVGDFIDRDAPTLLGKVDFGGMVRSIGRAWFLALLAALSGIVLAAQRAVSDIYDAITGFITDVYGGLFLIPAETQSAAVDAAAGELGQFEFLAAPVGTAAALASLGVIAVTIYSIVGGDG